MTVELHPDRRELGGVRLGSHRDDLIRSGDWCESFDEETGHYLDQDERGLAVQLVDDVVVSITARDECLFGKNDLIGSPLDLVVKLLDLADLTQSSSGEAVTFYESRDIGLLVADAIVLQLTLSDYSLIRE